MVHGRSGPFPRAVLTGKQRTMVEAGDTSMLFPAEAGDDSGICAIGAELVWRAALWKAASSGDGMTCRTMEGWLEKSLR